MAIFISYLDWQPKSGYGHVSHICVRRSKIISKPVAFALRIALTSLEHRLFHPHAQFRLDLVGEVDLDHHCRHSHK